LACLQVDHVASLLQAAHPGSEVELVAVTTTRDRRADTPVGEMGGQDVFVREVQAAVAAGRVDVAVHWRGLRPSNCGPRNGRANNVGPGP